MLARNAAHSIADRDAKEHEGSRSHACQQPACIKNPLAETHLCLHQFNLATGTAECADCIIMWAVMM